MAGIARRTLLRSAAAVALVPLGAGVATAAPAGRAQADPDERRRLEDAVGSDVRIVGTGGVVTAVLTEVRDLSHAPAGHPEAFSAVFRLDGEDTSVLTQGLVDIEAAGARWPTMGLLVGGDPGRRTAVLLVDRRPVSAHLAHAARL